MQIHCRCKQEFVVYEARFPHRVSCHVCGLKLMVREDGTTDEIRAITVSGNCRCGRPYTINALQFPRNVHCADCKHRFSVLDTGEIIDVEMDFDTAAPSDSTAIQPNAPGAWKAEIVTAIQEQLPCEPIPRAQQTSPSTSAEPKDERREELLALQLAAFDAKWQHQRQGYLFNFLYLVQFHPTRMISLMLFVAFVPTSALAALVMFSVFDVRASAAWCPLLIIGSVAFVFFANLFQRAALHDAAEQRWLKKRDDLIRLHDAKREYRSEMNPIDSDETAY